MSGQDFFIGWADTPKPDRRFFLRAGLGLMAGTGALAGGLASMQNPAGSGTWNPGDVREWRGIATAEPYAMLRTNELGVGPRTALLACLGKCGVTARIGSYAGKPVIIKGSLIQRGRHNMIAVVDDIDWIREDDGAADAMPSFPQVVTIGSVTLKGEILDSKCWFGAMRPSEGKVHKSCASLCIRGGLPPAFFARDRKGHSALMIMTDHGTAHGPDLLPFVADPVEITAEARRWGDMLLLDGPVSSIRRLGGAVS